MRNNEKNIENEMMEWRDQNDRIEDDGRMVKKQGNGVIKELGKDERLFEEKRKTLKYKKGNRVYTVHGRDCKRKSYPNPHTNPIFNDSPRPVTIRFFACVDVVH